MKFNGLQYNGIFLLFTIFCLLAPHAKAGWFSTQPQQQQNFYGQAVRYAKDKCNIALDSPGMSSSDSRCLDRQIKDYQDSPACSSSECKNAIDAGIKTDNSPPSASGSNECATGCAQQQASVPQRQQLDPAFEGNILNAAQRAFGQYR